VTNILNSDSDLLALGANFDKVEAAFDKKLNDQKRMNLPGVVSRKKQMIPMLMRVFSAL
jgi:manganese-dependent inorganic pyrophosphatase